MKLHNLRQNRKKSKQHPPPQKKKTKQKNTKKKHTYTPKTQRTGYILKLEMNV